MAKLYLITCLLATALKLCEFVVRQRIRLLALFFYQELGADFNYLGLRLKMNFNVNACSGTLVHSLLPERLEREV